MYIVHENYVQVIGKTWAGYEGLYQYPITAQDIETMAGATQSIKRADVAKWLKTHAGDFQSITDFHAMIDNAPGGSSVEFPWWNKENEELYENMQN